MASYLEAKDLMGFRDTRATRCATASPSSPDEAKYHPYGTWDPVPWKVLVMARSGSKPFGLLSTYEISKSTI